ncbi:uncharacterized protein [Sagmatias obliquidens]|uniref:uncharacterized protein n=1 Tax=Sagmatias obliquidens TaxID=3371155 RepID=UPI000F44049E|nr:uncharacterized protein LOC113609655 [Lagenorhynchus obliquidens]
MITGGESSAILPQHLDINPPQFCQPSGRRYRSSQPQGRLGRSSCFHLPQVQSLEKEHIVCLPRHENGRQRYSLLHITDEEPRPRTRGDAQDIEQERVCIITPLHRRGNRGQGCSVTRSRCLSPLPPGLRASSLAHKAGLLVFFPSQRQLQRAGDRPPPTPELILCCLPGGPGLNPRRWGLEEEASGGGCQLPGQPTVFHLYLNWLGLFPQQSVSPSTSVTSSAKTLNPGAWEEIRLQLTEGKLLPAAPPRDCSLAERLWAGRNVFVPGTKCNGPNWEKGALAAQVPGSEAGLAPGMSSCWPSSSSLGKRGQLPLPGHVLQAVKLKAPPRAGPAWSDAEP